MKKMIFIFMLFAIICTSCSIFDLGSDSVDSQIVGSWQLFRNSGGFGGIVLTPDSMGFNETHLYFKSDHTFSISLDDSIIEKGKYDLTRKDGDLYIKYRNTSNEFFPNDYVSFETSDTLILLDECFDCYINYYKRIK